MTNPLIYGATISAPPAAPDAGTVTASRGSLRAGRPARLLEPWSTPFALVNGAAVGLVPILLPIDAARYGAGHVGLVIGAFNLGALAAPAIGVLAERYHAHRAGTERRGGGCPGRPQRRQRLAVLLGPVVGGLAADFWGYPAALSIGAGAGLAGLAGLAIFVMTRARGHAASPVGDSG